MKECITFVSYVCLFPLIALGQASFQGLGDLPDGNFSSVAMSVSGDGAIVVGLGTLPIGSTPFRWSSEGGVTSLSGLPDNTWGWAYGVSTNGEVVGFTFSNTIIEEAFRWTESSGMSGLGYLPGGSVASTAFDVSANGAVVVGWSDSASSGQEAFHWTENSGMNALGDLPGGSFFSKASGVSADGMVVVGHGVSASGGEAFRWTADGVMEGLGDLDGGNFSSEAIATSANGAVVVGWSDSASGREAFRWTPDGGIIGLGDLPGGSFSSIALSVSGDGSIVVGRSESGSGDTTAFIWDEINGMRSLQDVLSEDYGLDLTGWNLILAADISTDGRTIVGTGFNPNGDSEGWIAMIPEPASVVVFALCALALARRRTREFTITSCN